MPDDQYEIHIVMRGNKKDFSPQDSKHIATIKGFMLDGKGIDYDEIVVVK